MSRLSPHAILPTTDEQQAGPGRFPEPEPGGGRHGPLHAHPHHRFPTTVHPPRQGHFAKEFALAASIQAKLFPAFLPELAGCELAARYRPAFLCGGDYYDVLALSDDQKHGHYLLCVADVSGKGLPASLLMSSLQATLRTFVVYRPPLTELVVRTNALLHARIPADRFITAILVDFEPDSGRCRFVNAGHNGGVLVRSDGMVEVLASTGPPLGMLESLAFSAESVVLRAGDVLSLDSDGVTEAFNPFEEEWGLERLLGCLSQWRHSKPETIITRVFEEIDSFAGKAPQHDDITILVLKRLGLPSPAP